MKVIRWIKIIVKIFKNHLFIYFLIFHEYLANFEAQFIIDNEDSRSQVTLVIDSDVIFFDIQIW